MAEAYWSWVERFFQRIPCLDYRLVSALVGMLTLFILIYFSAIFNSFSLYDSSNFDFYRVVTILSTSILITIEPIGIIYFSIRIRRISEMLKRGVIEHEKSNTILQDLNRRFTTNRLYNILAILIVAPSITMVAISYLTEDTFWHWEGTLLSLLFSILYYMIQFLISLMLATIIWILINISFLFKALSNEDVLSIININIFYGFKKGILNSLNDLLIKFSMYYFICVFFAILLYVSPAQKISYQMLLYISIDLLGILAFMFSWISLHEIFNRKWQEKVIEIDDLYNDKSQELMNCIKLNNKDEKEFQRLSSEIDNLQKLRDSLTQLIDSQNNLLSMIQVSISIMATILAFGQKVFDIFGLKIY